MKTNPRSFLHPKKWAISLFIILLMVVFSTFASSSLIASRGGDGEFFFLDGTLNPGDTINPSFPVFGADQPFNFSLMVSGGGPVDLLIENGTGGVIWDGTIEDGETVWGNGILTVGTNDITLTNTGGSLADFALSFVELPDTLPYTWSGTGSPTGLNSNAHVIFPSSGLYTFDFTVNGGESYQFALDLDYMLKTVTGTTSVTYFVPAGERNLTILQDTAGGMVDWSVAISGPSGTNDTLPYTKSGSGFAGNGDFTEEWLPLELAADTSVNLAVTMTGSAGDNVAIEVYDTVVGGSPILELDPVFAGEKTWGTVDLPAGTNRLRVVGNPGNGNNLAYAIQVNNLPTPTSSWDGVSNPAGLNSLIRHTFPASGLYTFDFTNNAGRYQFVVNNAFIRKTVEADSSVTLYIPAGTHDFTIEQDTTAGADWVVDVTQASSTNDTLPYTKVGGDIGGAGNDFMDEWLTLSLDGPETVNMSIETTGATGDNLIVEVYDATSSTPIFVLDDVLGTEKLWSNFNLTAGINRLHIIADGGNAGAMTYALEVSGMPTDTATWDGSSLAGGLNSQFIMDFAVGGAYQFDVSATDGFVNLVLDDFVASPLEGGNSTSYQIIVPAGQHVVHTIQDPAYPVADWTATVMPVTTGESFFTFNGTLDAGDMVVPLYSLPAGATLDFNFEMTVNGGDPVDLTIRDGSGGVIWNDSGLDSEVLWGTGTLTAGDNVFAISNSGATPSTVTLTLYYLPTAGYDWEGVADPAGVNSHIRVNFPTSGLYTFDSTVSGGRYQFLVNTDFIQKTIESNGAVTYFVPAGVHDLMIDQDNGTGANWSVDISDVGASSNALPYAKNGGNLGGIGNEFTEEWLPIELADDEQLNMSLSLTGTAGDALTIEIYDPTNGLVDMVDIFAGETQWRTFDLPAGTNLIRLLANGGNTASLTYNLDLFRIPDVTYTWAGSASFEGINGEIRLNFPNANLYDFNFTATAGRYQLQLDNSYILKTVEGATAVTYYVPAGIHNLHINQDSAVGANWSVDVASAGAGTTDSLPYTKSGGDLGGVGNDFTEEWLPIYTGQAEQVNIEVALNGNTADALALEVRSNLTGGTVLLTLNPIYGTETTWATVDLPAGGARIRLLANGGNTSSLSYNLTVHDIPEPTYTWSGTSLDNGLNATIRMNTPISGVYHVEVYMPDGFTNLLIDEGNFGPELEGGDFFYEFDVPLFAGQHTYVSEQSTTFPMTTYMITTTLLDASPPEVYAIMPMTVTPEVATAVVIDGFNFMPGATVEIALGGDTYALTSIAVVDANAVTAIVPAGLPEGTYDVIVTNPDGKSGSLTDGLVIKLPIYYMYMPIIDKEG